MTRCEALEAHDVDAPGSQFPQGRGAPGPESHDRSLSVPPSHVTHSRLSQVLRVHTTTRPRAYA